MLLFVQAQVQFLSFSYLPPFPISLTVILFTLCTVWGNYSQQGMQRDWGNVEMWQFQVWSPDWLLFAIARCHVNVSKGQQMHGYMLTCIWSWQVELRSGVPWSVAVTVKAYSARSANLRGEAVRSSPLVGLMEKRSALGPWEEAMHMEISSKLRWDKKTVK